MSLDGLGSTRKASRIDRIGSGGAPTGANALIATSLARMSDGPFWADRLPDDCGASVPQVEVASSAPSAQSGVGALRVGSPM